MLVIASGLGLHLRKLKAHGSAAERRALQRAEGSDGRVHRVEVDEADEPGWL